MTGILLFIVAWALIVIILLVTIVSLLWQIAEASNRSAEALTRLADIAVADRGNVVPLWPRRPAS